MNTAYYEMLMSLQQQVQVLIRSNTESIEPDKAAGIDLKATENRPDDLEHTYLSKIEMTM